MQLTRLSLTVAVTVWTLTATVLGQVKPKPVQMVYPPYVIGNDTLFYLQAINVTITNRQMKTRNVISFDGDAEVTGTGGTHNMTINVGYKNKMEKGGDSVENFVLHLEMGKAGGYWRLIRATMDGQINSGGVSILKNDEPQILLSRMELAAPLKMSFHCGRFGPLATKLTAEDLKQRPNATVSIELLDFQFQPNIKGELKFGRSYDCVGFFSIGILSGWFVTLILLGLLAWGIKMISNVNTMDRFDDPKGKTITVNATD